MKTGGALLLSPEFDRTEYLAAESLGLRSIAAVLRERSVEVRLVEECPVLLPPDIAEFAASCQIIGLGVLFTRQIPDALELARRIRVTAPGAHIVIGGQGLEFLWERVLEDCPALDSACMHEGDETIGDLWDRLVAGTEISGIPGLCVRNRGGMTLGKVRPPVADLDSLPFPLRETGPLHYPHGHATMVTSRGCMAHCTFCQSGNYGNRYHRLPRWRARSAELVVEEISALVEDHQIKAVSFVDDDFLGGDGQGRDRALRFAELLADRSYEITFSMECRINELDEELLTALREVGLRHLLIGVESANDRDLALFAKKTTAEEAEAAIVLLRRLGIDFSLGFIMFQPMSDLPGIRANLEFLRRNKVGSHRRLSNRLEVYPGSPLLSYFQRHGVVFREERYRLYYEFTDPRVSRLHKAYQTILMPFARVEEDCLRALFRESVDGLTDPIRRNGLRLLEEDIAAALVELATTCLESITEDNDPAAESEITFRVDERVSALTEQLRKREGEIHVDHG